MEPKAASKNSSERLTASPQHADKPQAVAGDLIQRAIESPSSATLTPAVVTLLQQKFGNQFVQRLLNKNGAVQISARSESAPVVQRMPLSSQDTEYINKLPEQQRMLARKRIEGFSGADEIKWKSLSVSMLTFIDTSSRSAYLTLLYTELAKQTNLNTIESLLGQFGGNTVNPRYAVYHVSEKDETAPLVTNTGKAPPRPARPELLFTTQTQQGEKAPSVTPTGNLSIKQPPLPPSQALKPKNLSLPAKEAETSFVPANKQEISVEKPSRPEGVPPDKFEDFLGFVWQNRTYYISIDDNAFYEQAYKVGDPKNKSGATYAKEDLRKVKGLTNAPDKEGYTSSESSDLTKGRFPASRVYVNTQPEAAPKVFQFVISEIVSKIEGVLYAKITNPEGAISDRDVIVIYISTLAPAKAVENVIQALGTYQKQHLDDFADQVPRLTQKRLPGVSTGDEPPNIYDERSEKLGLAPAVTEFQLSNRNAEGDMIWEFNKEAGNSFSQYRAKLIHQALVDTQTKNSDAFQSAVWAYFDKAGISKTDPSKQGPVKSGEVGVWTGLLRK